MRSLITILTGTKCSTIGIRQNRKAVAGMVSLGMRVVSSLRFSYARLVARYTVCYVPVSGHVEHAVAVRSQRAPQDQALGLLAARLRWQATRRGSVRRGRED